MCSRPSVDDPYTFGQIAAANSLSDIYAMGGRPLTALSIVGFPVRTLPDEAMHEILRGGIDKMTEAGVPVIGGHSINDGEVKAGFAVTGVIHPEKIASNAGARPGDRLILTKPLGTGVMAFRGADRPRAAGGTEGRDALDGRLNDRAAGLMLEFSAHACTDVTGFGLMGHLSRPWRPPAASMWNSTAARCRYFRAWRECLAEGMISGAVERNRESFGHCLAAGDGVPPSIIDLCFDPQTSGGLLIALPEEDAPALLRRLYREGIVEAAMVGKVIGPGSGRVYIHDARRCRRPGIEPISQFTFGDKDDGMLRTSCGNQPSGHRHWRSGSDPTEIPRFLQAANAPGGLAKFHPVNMKSEKVAAAAARRFAELGCTVEQAEPDFSGVQQIIHVTRALRMVTLHAEKLEKWRDQMNPNLVWNIEQGFPLTVKQIGEADKREDGTLPPGPPVLREI